MERKPSSTLHLNRWNHTALKLQYWGAQMDLYLPGESNPQPRLLAHWQDCFAIGSNNVDQVKVTLQRTALTEALHITVSLRVILQTELFQAGQRPDQRHVHKTNVNCVQVSQTSMPHITQSINQTKTTFYAVSPVLLNEFYFQKGNY